MDQDAQWFTDHPDRQSHIRPPVKTLHIDKQRATRYLDECEVEFQSLGEHKKDRRRILLYRIGVPPQDGKLPILKIPFLLFADETVEDRDDILLPIIHELMKEKAQEYGIQIPAMQ